MLTNSCTVYVCSFVGTWWWNPASETGLSPQCSLPKLLSNMTYLMARLRSEYLWVLALVSDWIKWFGFQRRFAKTGTCSSDCVCNSSHYSPMGSNYFAIQFNSQVPFLSNILCKHSSNSFRFLLSNQNQVRAQVSETEFCHQHVLVLLTVNPFTPKSAQFKTEEKSWISFCKIVKNKQHHLKVLLNSFHLNGRSLGFHLQSQKLEFIYWLWLWEWKG